MARLGNEVRFIKPETVCIGDTIRVLTHDSDVEVSKVGTVAKREQYTHGTDYLTASGIVLFSHHPSLKGPRITLLHRKATDAATLEGLDI